MKKLKVQPYNDYWFDCVNNNIIGILSAHDIRYKYLAASFQSTYNLVKLKPGIPIHDYLSENLTIPYHINVGFDRPDLSSILEQKS